MRALKHRQRRERRALNQAGRRRARQRSWPVIPDKHGPPVPGYVSAAWRRAEERYLHRYGWPLPDNWHARPRPRIPKLNTGGDHRHPVAMRIARQAVSDRRLPYRYWQNRMSKLWRWNWKRAAPPHPIGAPT